jgi:hypothetical protein
MLRLIIMIFSLIFAESAFAGRSFEKIDATFESGDGQNILLVSGLYFYFGPKDHPQSINFVHQYGQRIKKTESRGISCISFGIFTIARFRKNSHICNNVRINRYSINMDHSDVYEASCFILNGSQCKVTAGSGRPALAYGYKINRKTGVTHIFLSEKNTRTINSQLTLKSGKLLI